MKADPSAPALRILLVEDHAILVEGIRAILKKRGHVLAGVAARLPDAMRLLDTCEPDIAICDIELPDGSGLELVRAMRSRGVSALVLTAHEEPTYVHEAVRAGAKGYVVKSSPPQVLLSAVDAVGRGESYFCEVAMSALGKSDVPEELRGITPRELEVLRAVGDGLTMKEIGAALGISPRTVETHRERLMSKLGVTNAAGLTRMAVVVGVLHPRASGKSRTRSPDTD